MFTHKGRDLQSLNEEAKCFMKYGEVCMLTWHDKTQNETTRAIVEQLPELLPYPVDLLSFLTLPRSMFDATGDMAAASAATTHLPFTSRSTDSYDATTVAHYALAHWNYYLATHDEEYYRGFLTQAYWLVEHESRIGDDVGGWPILFPYPELHINGPCLSAVAQASGLSVMLRAYQLTHEEAFFAVARRVVCTFERDILDGG